MLAMTPGGYQSIRPSQIQTLYGPSPRDAGLYLVRVMSDVPGRVGRLRWVRVSELGLALWESCT